MKARRKTIILIIAVLVTASAFLFYVSAPLKVQYVTPQVRHLAQEVFGTGTVEARVLVTAGSKITGRVKKLYVDQGDFVRKGQLLAALESEDLQALVSQAVDTQQKSVSMETAARSELARAQANINAAESALQKSEATLKLARQTFERYDALFKKGMVSGQDLDEKQAALDEAMRQRDNLEAEKAAANAEAERVKNTLEAARHETGAGMASSTYAKAKLDDSNVRASVDGMVVSRDAEEGDAVVPGTSIFRIADPATIWVRANIDEAQGGGIMPGNAARVYLRSDRNTPVPGTVVRVAQESDRVTEELRVDVAFERKDGSRLHLGEQADAYVNGREKDCLSVPIKAVTVREGREGVFVVSGGKARFTPVKAGIMAKDFVEIVEGLKESDKVIMLKGDIGSKINGGARIKSSPLPSGG